MNRLIGEYTGEVHGNLVIGLAGIHGNEFAGIKALDLVLKMIEVEPITNPGFIFRGKLVALRGNLAALRLKKRYVDKDLNRNFRKTRLDKIRNGSQQISFSEDREALELIEMIEKEIEAYKPRKVIIIDLHTTSSPGGIFTIVTDEEESLRIAQEMHAPVIKGMIDGIKGTTMHYFNSANLGIETRAITFESGQHEDPNAIKIAIAAVVAGLRAIDCVNAHDVESLHDETLINYSKNLPSVTELIMKHSIEEGDNFRMKPNYLNFQKVSKGEVIAEDKNGPIAVEEDGILLMPLYQRLGEDGFFLIKNKPEYEVHQ